MRRYHGRRQVPNAPGRQQVGGAQSCRNGLGRKIKCTLQASLDRTLQSMLKQRRRSSYSRSCSRRTKN